MKHAKLEARRPQRLARCQRRVHVAQQPTPDKELARGEKDLMSPTDKTSVSHLEQWHEAHETLIILDWDDTIFPTSFVWQDDRLHWSVPAPCLDVDGAAPTVP